MLEDHLVRLKIYRGINLAKKDIFGASDPYVRITVVDQSTGAENLHGKTRTRKKTLNPVWNEEFIISLSPGQKIVLETFDENRLTRDDFLGLIEIASENIQTEQNGSLPPKDYLLHPRSSRSRVSGYMRIAVGYIDGQSTAHTEEDLQDAEDVGFDVIIERNRASPTPTPETRLEDITLEDPTPNTENSHFSHQISQISTDSDAYDAQSESSVGTLHADDQEQEAAAETEAVTNEISEPENQPQQPDESDGPRRAAPPTAEHSHVGTHFRNRPLDARHRDSMTSNVSIATLSNEEPLASGWEAKTDNTGRVFYIDHINHRTQWERPSRTNQQPLPQGWEERQDYNGRTYYVNHWTRVTQWQRPTGAAAAPTPAQTQLSTTAGLSSLYRNRRHISQEDTVEPSAEDAPEEEEVEEEEQEGEGEATEEEPAAAATQEEEEEPLPAGWAMAQTPSGRKFYIDHNTRVTTWINPRLQQARGEQLEVPDSPVCRASSNEDLLKDLGPLPAGWEERVNHDGRVFYVNHMTRNTQWEDPRLEKFGGPAVPYSRDYKRKYDYFRSKLRKPNNVPNKIDIKISRATILEDSFNVISNVKRPDLLKTRLWIEFDGETGLDYGGVAREWFYLLSKEAFNPYYGLFEYSATDDYTLQINPNSGLANESHLMYFKFIGRVAGMAVFHGKLLDGFFIRPFYKMMLGKQIMLRDMESVDSEYYNSLVWILENDPECLELTFSVDEEYFGETVERELIPGGRNVPVNENNKRQYIDLIIEWRFVERVKKQMIALMDGFNDIIPQELIKIFDENELELLMCGLQDIDVKDWKLYTVYKGEYNPNHPVIVHFWKACYSFNNEMRSRLLQFVTGTSRVPMNGFRELHGSNGPQLFTIEKWGRPSQLPRAHTCFNRLDLPPYDTYEELRKKLLTAVESTEGFEGVD